MQLRGWCLLPISMPMIRIHRASGVRVQGLGIMVEGLGLVFKAHRLLYHSTLGLRIIKKKKRILEIMIEGLEFDLRPISTPEPSGFRRAIDRCWKSCHQRERERE